MQDLHVSIAALKRKLGLLFLAAAAVIVAGALLYYRHYSRNVELEKDELLASIAKGKIQQLAVWREDRLARVRSLLDSPILSINLRRFADEPEDRENTSLVRRRLESFILNSVYRGAFLAERSGKILLSAGKLSPGAPCPEVRRLLAGAAAEHGPVIGEIHRDSAGKPGIHVVSLAAVSAAGKKIFLVTCIDPEDYLYPLVQAWPTNSASAETLLVKEDKGEILFLNELRNKKDTALNFRLPSDTPSLPAAAGVRGITGVMRGVDYRGVKVLAYTAPVPGSNWSLVAKIDESEVFSETRTPSALLVLLVLTMLGASGIGAFLLFRLQTEAYLRAYQEAHADKARAEDALQETEEIFNQFMEHNPLYVFFKDENLRALHLSRNFETWLGRPMNDLLGKSMAELFPSELADKIVADDKRILAEGKEVIVEEELHGRSYRTIKFPIRVPGKPAYLAGYTMDITEYKQALKALEEGRRLLAETEKVGKVGGWEFNIDTMRQRWTDEVYSIHELEITPDPTVAAGINYYTPESRPLIERAVQRAIEHGESFDLELEITTAKGNRRSVHTVGKADLPARRVYGFFQDVTQAKLAEAALRESETRFQQLFQTMEEGFATHEIICDSAGRPVDYRFLDVNPAFERLTGLKKQDIVGKTVLEVMPDTEKVWIDNYGQVALGGTPMSFESTSGPLGKCYEVRAFSPERGKFAVTFFDVTERKLARLKLEKLNQDLSDKKQEMENFLYITTHDLRSPLVNIQGFSQNLRTYLAEFRELLARAQVPPAEKDRVEKLLNEKIPETLAFVLGGSQKMDALITALLKVSRVGRVEMRPEKLDTAAVINKNLAALRFQLETSGGAVHLGALPPCYADPGAVSQLFANLLDNAIKYRHPDRSPEIRVSGETRGAVTVYTVADNGAGIPGTDLARIWNVFYHPEHATERKGEGIGLPMVRRLVEKNGGSIRAESKLGEGTVFYVELPAAGGGKHGD